MRTSLLNRGTGSCDSPPPPSCLGAASWFTAWRENRLGQVRLAQVRPTTRPLVLGCACVRKARVEPSSKVVGAGPHPDPCKPLEAELSSEAASSPSGPYELREGEQSITLPPQSLLLIYNFVHHKRKKHTI